MTFTRGLFHLFLFSTLLVDADTQVRNRPPDAQLAEITERGVFLAEYDSAAWKASDAMQAIDPMINRMGRYIARKTSGRWIVDFGRLNATGDKFLLAYEAVQKSNLRDFEIRTFDPVKEDTGWTLAAARAIEIAARDFGSTTRPYNTAVLPAHANSLYVYLYPAQINAGVYPLGADVRYRVSADGANILEKRQLHKSIIESAPASSNLKVKVGYHTHVLSDLPEDSDVLLVLIRRPRIPEIVVTGSYIFTIGVNAKITVEDRAKR